MPVDLSIARYVAAWRASPFGDHEGLAWTATGSAERLIAAALETLERDHALHGDVAVHRSAMIEAGAVVKGPAIVGPGCLVAAGAYLRGGKYLQANCIVGPGSELKSSFMFAGSKLAHLNFVGDSIIGSDVNVEAGAIIANHRNECADKTIRILVGDEIVPTGVDKFGALIGDGARIGANAVIAPGALVPPDGRVGRLELLDQSPR